jgi:hypothetical protein
MANGLSKISKKMNMNATAKKSWARVESVNDGLVRATGVAVVFFFDDFF